MHTKRNLGRDFEIALVGKISIELAVSFHLTGPPLAVTWMF
ncbi:hypothetical protein [Polystyrenella longa]|nr:hypothetical protein [Polystyrenella longa]